MRQNNIIPSQPDTPELNVNCLKFQTSPVTASMLTSYNQPYFQPKNKQDGPLNLMHVSLTLSIFLMSVD